MLLKSHPVNKHNITSVYRINKSPRRLSSCSSGESGESNLGIGIKEETFPSGGRRIGKIKEFGSLIRSLTRFQEP